MFNPLKRFPADPSNRFYKGFRRLSDKGVFKIYSQKAGDADVSGVSGFVSVVRLNSTYLELVDRFYNWRGTITLGAGIIFCSMFIRGFLWLLVPVILPGEGP